MLLQPTLTQEVGVLHTEEPLGPFHQVLRFVQMIVVWRTLSPYPMIPVMSREAPGLTSLLPSRVTTLHVCACRKTRIEKGRGLLIDVNQRMCHIVQVKEPCAAAKKLFAPK